MASCTLPRGVLKRGLNDVLEQHVGSFGTYQKIAIFLISLPTVVTGMTLLDVMYLTASPHFWYVYNGEQLNRTIIQTKMDECKLENGTSIDELGDGYWQYDETEFRTSIVSRVSNFLCCWYQFSFHSWHSNHIQHSEDTPMCFLILPKNRVTYIWNLIYGHATCCVFHKMLTFVTLLCFRGYMMNIYWICDIY